MTHRSVAGGFVGLLIVLASAGRLVHLDADPSIPTWIGYFVDEGRWIETARNLALFGDPDVNWLSRIHLFMSPGYQAVSYIVFRSFGVDFWSARFFSAVSGALVVLAVFLVLRRHVSALALAFGVVVLGLETNLFAFSRLALPEMPAVLATLLAFLLLVCGRTKPWSAALAGMIGAGAVAMKGSSVLIVMIFPVVALIAPDKTPLRSRVVRSAAFVGGFTLPVVAGLAVLSALGFLEAHAVGAIADRLLDFLAWTGPYTTVGRFFDDAELEARNLLLLGVWSCSWLWFHRRSPTPSPARELYLASAIWAGWWLIVWSPNEYLPGRYVVHFIVPATIHIMAGLSLGGRDIATQIVASLRRDQRVRRAVISCWLVLPSAIVLSSLVAGVAGWGGWSIDRLSERIIVIAVITGLLAALVSFRFAGERSIAGFLSFPVVMALLWLGGGELELFSKFWVFDSAARVAIWCAVASAAFVLCFALAPRALRQPAIAGAAAIIVLAAIFLAQAAPPVLFPTYSLRDASRDLTRYLPADAPIRTVVASSLFIGNGIKYRELRTEDQQIDALVLLEHDPIARRFLASERSAHLVRVRVFPLTVHPSFRPAWGWLDVPSVGIYRAK